MTGQSEGLFDLMFQHAVLFDQDSPGCRMFGAQRIGRLQNMVVRIDGEDPDLALVEAHVLNAHFQMGVRRAAEAELVSGYAPLELG